MTVVKSDLTRGDILWVNFGTRGGEKLAKVVKINSVNVKLECADGTRVNANPIFLRWASESEAASFTSSSPAPAHIPGGSMPLVLGQVVKFKIPRGKVHEGLFVVLGQTRDKYRVARLGGDKNRYIRNVTSLSVEVVDFDVAGV